MQEKRNITIEPKVHKLNTLDNGEIPKKRVCAYARVSTDQEDQIHSYHTQIKDYTERIQSNPNWELKGLYADEGMNITKTVSTDPNNKI